MVGKPELVQAIREALERTERSQSEISVALGHHKNWLGRVLRGGIRDVKQKDIDGLRREIELDVPTAPAEYVDFRRIPVVAEGSASLKGGAVNEWVYMPRSETAGTSDQHLIGIRSRGNCIEPDIVDGDVVITDTSATARTGDIVAVAIEGTTHLKRYRQRGTRHVVFSNEGEATIEPHQIQGVMLGFYRQHRR